LKTESNLKVFTALHTKMQEKWLWPVCLKFDHHWCENESLPSGSDVEVNSPFGAFGENEGAPTTVCACSEIIEAKIVMARAEFALPLVCALDWVLASLLGSCWLELSCVWAALSDLIWENLYFSPDACALLIENAGSGMMKKSHASPFLQMPSRWFRQTSLLDLPDGDVPLGFVDFSEGDLTRAPASSGDRLRSLHLPFVCLCLLLCLCLLFSFQVRERKSDCLSSNDHGAPTPCIHHVELRVRLASHYHQKPKVWKLHLGYFEYDNNKQWDHPSSSDLTRQLHSTLARDRLKTISINTPGSISWHKCAANCENEFEVRQLPYGNPEVQSASFVSMSRETHENAESYINNEMFLIQV
jgi:hypothetical protein